MKSILNFFRKKPNSCRSIVGTWADQVDDGIRPSPRDGADVVTILADGTLTFSRRYSKYEVVLSRFSYVADGTKIIATREGGSQTMEIPFSFPAESSLILDINGEMHLHRVDKPKTLPRVGVAVGLPAQTPIESYSDIRFIVNNEECGMTMLVGPPDGPKFFAQHQKYLHGEATVTFTVGEQVVTNRVILKGNEYRVNTNFSPPDIEALVAEQKRRVKREMADAHFVEQPTDIFYLSASALLGGATRFPEFNRAILVNDPKGERYFVSHRWLTPHHPDPEGDHMALLKAHAVRHPNANYWIDFCCLPQSRNSADQDLFNKTLPKIASIQAKASTIIIGAPDYDERLWCHVEHLTALFFTQVHYTEGIGDAPRTLVYLGDYRPDTRGMLARVQALQEPQWDRFKVTKKSDIPGIRYNYRWLTNLVKFQFFDSFNELRCSLPGHDLFTGLHYSQNVFGIDYSCTLQTILGLFEEYGGDRQLLFKPGALPWLAERFSWSTAPDKYKVEEFRFSAALVFSRDMVAWLALLLAMVKVVNLNTGPVLTMRKEYATIVLMSMFK